MFKYEWYPGTEMHDQDVTEIEEERVPHYGNIPPPVIIHDHQDELETENAEIYDFETEIIDTDNELIQEADVDDGTGAELNLIESTVEDVQINIKEEDIDVEEIGATEMDREIIMDEDNLSPNSENNEEMNIKGSENDSDTNISYDDSSSIIVSSIESTPIASINGRNPIDVALFFQRVFPDKVKILDYHAPDIGVNFFAMVYRHPKLAPLQKTWQHG